MMVAIVGCDGAGKTSATRVLTAALAAELRVRQVDKWHVLDSERYPAYRFMSKDLPTLRRCVSDMPEVTRTLFLFWTLHGTLTPEATAGADVVVLDGYWAKHAASEIVYSGRRDLVNALVAIMPRPDRTLLLDVDPEIAYRRRIADLSTPLVPYECGLDPACSKEAFLRHQEATRALLLEWCHELGWVRIDANQEPAAVADAVSRAAGAIMAGGRSA